MNNNQTLMIIGITVIVIVIIIQSIVRDTTESYVDTIESSIDTVTPDRQLIINPQRNEILYEFFGCTCFNGILDTSMHKNAFKDLQSRMTFYPFQVNYDVLCDAIDDESSKDLQQSRKANCSMYDLDTFALPESRRLLAYQPSIFQYANDNEFIKNSSYVMIDNNFYNIFKGSTRLHLSKDEKIHYITDKYVDKLRNYFVITLINVSPWFVFARPTILYIHMIGYFRVVYDYIPDDNVMCTYISKLGMPYKLIIEPLKKSYGGKELAGQGELQNNDDILDSLTAQLERNNVTIYYLRPSREIPIVPPLKFATVATIFLKFGVIQNFPIGAKNENLPKDSSFKLLNTLNILYNEKEEGDQTFIGLTVLANTNKRIFNDFALDMILTMKMCEQLIITFAFNVMTVIAMATFLDPLNPNAQPIKTTYIKRVALSGTFADHTFALKTDLKQTNQFQIMYSIPSYVDHISNLNWE